VVEIGFVLFVGLILARCFLRLPVGVLVIADFGQPRVEIG
jgi:hypothetical protein